MPANFEALGHTILWGCRTTALEKAIFGISCHFLAGEFSIICVSLTFKALYLRHFKDH